MKVIGDTVTAFLNIVNHNRSDRARARQMPWSARSTKPARLQSQALVTESDISILVSNDLAIAQPHLHLAWDH